MQQSAIKASWKERLTSWWINGMPPLDGRLRFTFYMGMLALLLKSYAPTHLLDASFRSGGPELYESVGFMKLMNLEVISHDSLYSVLRILRRILYLTCFFSALGFLGRTPVYLTGACLFILHGVSMGSITSSHTWYLPVHASVILCFARSNDRWSVDHFLQERLRWYPRFDRGGPLTSSGFARQLLLVTTVGLFFSAGIAKILAGGWEWMDGASLQWYMREYAERRTRFGSEPRFPFINSLVSERLWLCSALSVFSMAIELGAIAALFSRTYKHLLILAWLAFHLGIYFTMLPQFGPQAWCYILLVDWVWLGARVRSFWHKQDDLPLPSNPGMTPTAPSIRAGVILGTALAAFWVFVSFAKIEQWPISHIPMYSTYVGNGQVAGIEWEDFGDPLRVQEHAQRCAQTQCEWSEVRHFGRNGRAWLQVITPAGEARTLSHRDFRTMLWRRVEGLIQKAVIQDFAAKPRGRLAFESTAPAYPGTHFLERIAPRIQALLTDGAQYERLELVYKLHDGNVVIASARF